jgi:hypothetical protein
MSVGIFIDWIGYEMTLLDPSALGLIRRQEEMVEAAQRKKSTTTQELVAKEEEKRLLKHLRMPL